MTRKWLWTLGILALLTGGRVGAAAMAGVRPTGACSTDGVVHRVSAAQSRQRPDHDRAGSGRHASGSPKAPAIASAGCSPDGTGLKEFPLPNPNSSPRIIALGVGRQHVVLGAHRQPDGPHHARRHDRRVPDSRRPTACRARSRSAPTATSGSASSAAARSAASPRRASITEFPIPTPDSGPRALAAGPDGNIWFSEFNASKIGRITPAGRDHRVPAAAPQLRPGRHHRRRRRATCGSSSSRARWTAASRTATASAASRWTGEITEFPIPSADRVADQHRRRPGSQRLVHEGRAASAA